MVTKTDALRLARARWGEQARVEYRPKAPLVETPAGQKAAKLLRLAGKLQCDLGQVLGADVHIGETDPESVAQSIVRCYRKLDPKDVRRWLLLTAKSLTAGTVRAAVAARWQQITRLRAAAEALIPGCPRRGALVPNRCVIGRTLALPELGAFFVIRGAGDTWESALAKAKLLEKD